MVLTAAATPPRRTVLAETTFPSEISAEILSKFWFTTAKSGIPAASRINDTNTTVLPGFLNSGEMTRPASTGATANATRVGGTSSSLNDPDMLSLPPIAATSNCICAHNAPNTALNGFPQRTSSWPSFSKYSCSVRRARLGSPPMATILATASVTA